MTPGPKITAALLALAVQAAHLIAQPATQPAAEGPGAVFSAVIKALKENNIDAAATLMIDGEAPDVRIVLAKMAKGLQEPGNDIIVLGGETIGDVGYAVVDTIRPGRTKPKIEASPAILVDGKWMLVAQPDKLQIADDHKNRLMEVIVLAQERTRAMSGKSTTTPSTQATP
ncbi:MAG TPA: hypothetical protein VGB55_12480 [Tepidisphaeraceae bacterium]|jgi:hypothetical protein